MSTDSSRDGPSQVAARPARRSGPWTGAALLLALIALAAGAWSLLELRRISDRGDALTLELQQAGIRIQAAAREAGDLRAQVRELADHDAGVDRRLDETRAALQRVAQTNGNVDFALAEVEYLLILAEQRLALMQDVDSARAALQAVERRLDGLYAPGLDAVRGQVGADLLRLARVPGIDYSQWIEELGELAAVAEALPLRAEMPAVAAVPAAAAAPAAQGWRGFLHAVWQELSDMVVITRNAPGSAPLPGEHYYLVQNLLLRIETARLALLRRDTRALHDAAASATDWLRRWFDAGDPRVRTALDRLQALSVLDPTAPLPDITSSLETLRALIRERAAPVPLTPAPPSEP